ncbi:hypothetical protein V1511DRAFT_497040 [Dipodascopsis uninucleata]
MRKQRKYELYRSPLVQLEFWRVILDEVQLVETGVGNAAQVARMVPRFHSWGVSGTPVRNELSDLAGLLKFLRLLPYNQGQQVKIWDRLCHDSKAFCDLFHGISIRHTKDMVRDSIALPPQRRIALTIPFNTVEENNYRHLVQEFLSDCGLNASGAPTQNDWDPTEALPKMSRWLGRLRQTCCHPQIGIGNRRALGGGPLRTVDDVLEAMYDAAQSTVLTDERSYWTSQIQRAQLLEQATEREPALEVFSKALEGIRKTVTYCRKQVNEEQERINATRLNSTKDDNSTDQEEDMTAKSRLLSARLRVRTFLELEHRCLFFIASINFQLENKELEIEYYDLAEKARRELLQESESKAQRLMDSINEIANKQDFVEIPEIIEVDEVTGGLESRSIINRAREISAILNEQANQLDEWREKVISLLCQNLVDKDAEPDGEEYGESLDAQEEAFSYQEAIRQALADRNEAVSGVRNNLVEHDITRENLLDKRTDLAKKLFEERKKYKVSPILGSLKVVYDDLRRLVTQKGYDIEDSEAERQKRLRIEYSIANTELEKLRLCIADQRKVLDALDREHLLFRSVYNARIEYYKQLQQLSDGVAEFDPKEPEKFSKTALASEAKLLLRIDKGYARLRYLEHLKSSMLSKTGSVPESERICVICQCPFEIGSLTVCGHQYCRDCMLEWWKFHRSCPICKRDIKTSDIYSISYKPNDIKIKEEKSQSPHHLNVSRAIYSEMNQEILNEIKNIDLSGSYGSKIDMILRHILWLRENEPNVQVVLFSQWSDFLNLLTIAMDRHEIKHASVEKGIDEFKRNPDIMCFLLHAKSQSSGLTLINATHVFLCEPLFNTALELQAISRVHRIGQTRSTTVWMYAIGGTVEESVLELTTKKRLNLLNQTADHKSNELLSTDARLDISNSIELQKASGRMMSKNNEGEIVPLDELWDLFFGESAVKTYAKDVNALDVELSKNDIEQTYGFSAEYRRFMAADAAERRAF